MPTQIEPFTAQVPQQHLDDLRDRLRRTRWPEEVTDAEWDYGVPLGWLRRIVSYWSDEFDWRAQEARINALPNFIADIDGFKVHFIWAKGKGEGRMPLLLLHGWPSSFVEYLDLVPKLVRDGFDVILPSLPGYGFSQIPLTRGFTSRRIGEVMFTLMDALGYDRFGIHAHDHGASAAVPLARIHPERVLWYHTTEPAIGGLTVGRDTPNLSAAEQAYFDFRDQWQSEDSGYASIQETRPQTLAYAMNDSPAGLAAWILDKWQVWTAPPSGDLLDSFTMDELLANVSLYWLTETANYGARAYYDNRHYREPLPAHATSTLVVPTGVALVATQQIERAPRALIERGFSDIRHWVELPRGGHFIAGEEPELLAGSIRDFAASLASQDRIEG